MLALGGAEWVRVQVPGCSDGVGGEDRTRGGSKSLAGGGCTVKT